MADKKLCLVIGPFGPTKSFEKARAAWLSREIINPVFEAHFPDFVVKNARTYFIPEEIERQVVPDIAEAKLVIVDMPSDLGSMYQLGWCLLNRTPVVFIATGETWARPWRAWRYLKFIFVEQRGNVEQSRHELRSEIERVLGESGLNSLPQPAPATKHELAVRI